MRYATCDTGRRVRRQYKIRTQDKDKEAKEVAELGGAQPQDKRRHATADHMRGAKH